MQEGIQHNMNWTHKRLWEFSKGHVTYKPIYIKSKIKRLQHNTYDLFRYCDSFSRQLTRSMLM